MILIFLQNGYSSNHNWMIHSILPPSATKISISHLEIWAQTNHFVTIVNMINYKIFTLIIHIFQLKGYKMHSAIIVLLFMANKIISLINFSLLNIAANMYLHLLHLQKYK